MLALVVMLQYVSRVKASHRSSRKSDSVFRLMATILMYANTFFKLYSLLRVKCIFFQMRCTVKIIIIAISFQEGNIFGTSASPYTLSFEHTGKMNNKSNTNRKRTDVDN